MLKNNIEYKGITKIYNDILFIGSYVEYISRVLKRKQIEIIDTIGYDNLKHIYEHSCVNHCLTYEQHLYEFQEEYNLTLGTYDMEKYYKGLSIESCSIAASPIARMVDSLEDDYFKAFDKFWEIYHSWFVDILFDWKTALYRQPCFYLIHSYKQGFVDFEEYPSII